jgi:hypothetical protein
VVRSYSYGIGWTPFVKWLCLSAEAMVSVRHLRTIMFRNMALAGNEMVTEMHSLKWVIHCNVLEGSIHDRTLL